MNTIRKLVAICPIAVECWSRDIFCYEEYLDLCRHTNTLAKDKFEQVKRICNKQFNKDMEGTAG